MTGTSRNRWRRRTAIALSLSLALLLASCDRQAGPNGPTPPPTPPRSTGPIAFVSDRDGTDRVYLANEDGSTVTPLVAGWNRAWAKDGRRIAFSARSDVHVIGVDGSGDRGIAGNGSHPAWSPDGRSIVFTSWSGDSELDLVNPDGSNRRSLYDSGSRAYAPKWSPDGQRILFTINPGYQDWCFGCGP